MSDRLWWATGFANRYGDVVQGWSCPLPAGFTRRLAEDPAGLEREVHARAAAVGGTVIECGPMVVDGRPAFYRIVRLPAGEVLASAVYVVGLVVPLAAPGNHGPRRGDSSRG